MIKIKLLVGVAALLAVTALSAAPAGAWFKSLNGTSQGKVQSSKTELNAGGAKVSCESAEGEWHLQSAGVWWEHEKEGKQVKTLEGPHLYIKITKWNKCKATVALESVAATVEPCEFQLKQPEKGVNKGTATLVSACVIKAALKPTACVITVAAGDHSGTNELLKEISGENSESLTEVLGTAEVAEGIHGKASCLKPEEFVKGSFKSEKGGLIAHALQLV